MCVLNKYDVFVGDETVEIRRGQGLGWKIVLS